jgi:hypothetical protein
MRSFFVLFLILAGTVGCAPVDSVLRPTSVQSDGPQRFNRMQISENTDLFGV